MGLGRILKSIFERITNTMDDSAGSPTYGVEIEFAVPSIHVSWPDPDPDITDQVLFRTTEPGGLDMMAQVREQLCR
ncbi:hypothetical protein SAMD00023353_2500780 [Rosellinia necatrix]|uniref:Uncharacterized protein n=1 Tax=Rosellinia necatrix TaxID=77044 RepID=A0A1S8A855_ROSNE|nr:hypothetical protein SAMD00023353_2500780 [Rosellinia necatrix]